jgi:hypothetical protein
VLWQCGVVRSKVVVRQPVFELLLMDAYRTELVNNSLYALLHITILLHITMLCSYLCGKRTQLFALELHACIW